MSGSRYETEISAVEVNWSVLVGSREIHQSGSLLHKEAVDSYFKLISKLESISIIVIFTSQYSAGKVLFNKAKT